MAEFVRAKIAEIFVGTERLRKPTPESVAARAVSMAEHGQITPITVRRTPAKNKGETPFTLVAGETRLLAAGSLDWTEIDAVIVRADAVDAQMLEISENLHRDELNALDRAIFVLKYRELWEAKHGKIAQGGDRKSNSHDANLIFAGGRELSAVVQSQLGFGKDAYHRATRIGKNLHPTLRQAVRGTEAENDQSKLLKLSKLSADDQVKVAAALKESGNLKPVLEWLKGPKGAVDPQDEIFKKVAALLAKADPATLRRIADHIGELADFSFLEAA
ncbi:ParB N-terminal domain-containing protein [Rhizobium leguminosarum]